MNAVLPPLSLPSGTAAPSSSSSALAREGSSMMTSSSSATDYEFQGTIIAVLFAKFDTKQGNTIAFTCPPSTVLDVHDLVDCRSIQDYAFPDGAHDNMTDVVAAVLRKKSRNNNNNRTTAMLSSTALQMVEENSSGLVAFSNTSTTSTTGCFGIPEAGPIFLTSLYHQKRDASADRGATQRGMMVLSTQPLYYALQSFFQLVVVPFFDMVPMSHDEAHEAMTKAIYLSLSDAFSIRTSRAEWGVQPRSRIADVVEASFDKKGTIMTSFDSERCDQRVIRFAVRIMPPGSGTDPHLVRHALDTRRGGAAAAHHHDNTEPTFECDTVLPVPLPCNEATLTQRVAFGASLKMLMTWLGSSVATLHWCLLARIPVLFMGLCAKDVCDAVRASVLLMQPLEVDVSRFAPYCTLEHVDYFSANPSACVFLALGATNAYVRHKDFPGAAKCDLSTGKIELIDRSVLKRMPKSHGKSFDDLCMAARDPAVAESYIRARAARFNLAIMRQMSASKGLYYDALSRMTNIFDNPLHGPASASPAVLMETDENHEDSSGFLMVDDSFPKATPAVSAASAAVRLQPNIESNQSLHQSQSASPVEPLSPTNQQQEHTNDDLLPPSSATAALLRDTSPDADFADDPVSRRRKALLAELSTSIIMYEEHSKRNHQMILDVDGWYKDMCHVLKVVSLDSERWHRSLVDELSTFSVMGEVPVDPSLAYCVSQLAAGCDSRQRWDRTQRLRIVQDYRERVFLMIDALSKNNARALCRKDNRRVCDFFQFQPGVECLALPQQVLLHSTSCKTVWYVKRAKVTISGAIHLTRNYLLFEAGSFAIRKRHQIVPFDAVRSVVKDQTSVFSTTVKLLLDVPPSTDESSRNDDATMRQGLLLVSNVSNSDGFFQLLHALTHRQRRLLKLMESIPPPHSIPQGAIAGHMFLPVTVPMGLYSMQDQWFFDEVWENQRLYPIVGWSSRLLPSDPDSMSDFSCTRSLEMSSWEMPEGFTVVYDWRLAKEARIADSALQGVLSDEMMLKYGRIETPYMMRRRSSDSDGDEPPATTTADTSSSTDAGGTAVRPAIEWLYNNSFIGIDTFRMTSFLGCTVRRRLWIRVRKIHRSPNAAASILAEEERIVLGGRQRTDDTVSTSSSDMVEGSSEVGLGVPQPEVEENDDS